MKESNIHTLLTVAIFVILFMSIGWMAPSLHASYAPEDRFIEVHQFEPNNVTVDSESHAVCFNRDVHEDTTGEVIMELYLLDENGVEREVDTEVFRSYFEAGDDVTSFTMPLPEERLETGEYQYQAVVTMELADGRVDRTFTWESDTFFVKEEANISTNDIGKGMDSC